MRVALLSAGPSLRKSYDPAAHHDLRIGVNTAVEFYPCDWWACADSHRWIDIAKRGVVGHPKVYAIDAQRDRTQGLEPKLFSKFDWTGWDEVFDAVGASRKWMNNTAPAALILAAWLGATEVECFGVDMAGDMDATGRRDDATHYRNEQRWQLERGIWTLIVQWLFERGTKVKRHGVQP